MAGNSDVLQIDERIAGDALAWFLNVASSVLIVFVNKVLMSGFHFSFDTLIFSLVAGTSIATLNLSLLINSVGFYQISKLLIIPFVCLLEYTWFRKRFTIPVLLAIGIVVAGVGIVTVTDLSVKQLSTLGLIMALLSVVTSGLQQVLCGFIQRKHCLTSNQLLSNTAPVQGTMLLATGPFIDKLITSKWVLQFTWGVGSVEFLALSCAVAALVNISQFMCLGRFSAVTFQVLGHTKTVLVLLVGWMYFHDQISSRKLLGMALAVTGMVGYGIVSGWQQAGCHKPPSGGLLPKTLSGGPLPKTLSGSFPGKGLSLLLQSKSRSSYTSLSDKDWNAEDDSRKGDLRKVPSGDGRGLPTHLSKGFV